MQSQGPGVFRSEAVQQLNAPEQSDQLMELASPRSWLLVVGVIVIILALGFWAFGGSPAPQVSGKGILLHPPGLYNAETDTAGMITAIAVNLGDTVHAGQTLAMLQPPNSAPVPLVSRQDGTVVSVQVTRYQVVTPGTPIASLEPLTKVLRAVVYVPVAQGKDIHPGDEARISPALLNKEEYGVMLGTVESITPFPVSNARIQLVVGNASLAKALTAGGAVYEVQVRVLPDPNVKSGVKWSSGRGPNLPITSGTLCNVDVLLAGSGPLQSMNLPPAN